MFQRINNIKISVNKISLVSFLLFQVTFVNHHHRYNLEAVTNYESGSSSTAIQSLEHPDYCSLFQFTSNLISSISNNHVSADTELLSRISVSKVSKLSFLFIQSKDLRAPPVQFFA